MSEVSVSKQDPKVPARLAQTIGGLDANDDLSSGVSGGFAVMSYRGSKWRVKHGGEETLVTNDDGEAAPSIQVVLLRANRHISKNYYPGKYVEGSNDTPACWSVDGVRPDAGVPTPQSQTCAACKWNAFGSRMTDDGRKAKACGDSRRLAIVPMNDLSNEIYGGPMLLRTPAASLSDLATYGKAMKAKGYPYNTVVTRVGFDNDAAYPKLTFKPVRILNAQEETQLLELLADPEFGGKVTTVLAVATELVVDTPPAAAPPVQATQAPPPPVQAAAPPPPADPFAFEQDAAPTVKPATRKPATKKPVVTAAPVQPTVTVASEEGGELDDEISNILKQLDDVS